MASQTNQGMKNPIEGQQVQIDETSSFSRLMANNASNIGNIAKEDVGQSTVNASSINLEGTQNNSPSSSINGLTSNLLSTSNPEIKPRNPKY